MYQIKLTRQARQELKGLKKIYQDAVNIALLEIKEEPHYNKFLAQELKGKISYRLGVYRIIYTLNEKDKIITILTAGHRATVYGG